MRLGSVSALRSRRWTGPVRGIILPKKVDRFLRRIAVEYPLEEGLVAPEDILEAAGFFI